MITGVIEKRRYTGDHGNRSELGEGTATENAGPVDGSATGTDEAGPGFRRSGAFDKVRMKGGDPAIRRPDSRNKKHVTTARRESIDVRSPSIDQEPGFGRDQESTENTPLLGGNGKDAPLLRVGN